MVKIKTAILILGDIILLYLSLATTLLIRYGGSDWQENFNNHLGPLSFVFILWILVFYLLDLYELRILKSAPDLLRRLSTAILINISSAFILFYLLTGFFELTPKTNLVILGAVFGILDFGWRFLVIRAGYVRTNLIIIGETPLTREISAFLKANPQIGYYLVSSPSYNNPKNLDLWSFKKELSENKVDIVVISFDLPKGNSSLTKLIYQLLPLKIKIMEAIDFYEMLFRKIPVDELNEEWFIEKITTRRNLYDSLKRFMDILLGVVFSVILSPVMTISALIVKFTSAGPIIYKQKRMGRNEKSFVAYKFRTMTDGEKGPLWTVSEDKRITRVGKILRHTHLDELPQLWNIVKGDMSFIGPRAERLELAQKFGEIPRYEIRHIIKPGLTGWAQLNYKPSASLKEAEEKLKYDIYYIKNRSFVLDLLIILKTITLFFISRPQS